MHKGTAKSKVKRTGVRKKKASDQVEILKAVCTQGAQSSKVAASSTAAAALGNLTTATNTLAGSVVSHTALALAFRSSGTTVRQNSAAAEKAAVSYMNAVDDIAAGDPVVINEAGLQARAGSAHVASAAIVTHVQGGPGKVSKEAVVGWAASAGAGAYKLRVNFTPADPTKWELLPEGTKRHRTITAPTPGAQFLVSVAAIGSEAPSDWSDAVMVTAR